MDSGAVCSMDMGFKIGSIFYGPLLKSLCKIHVLLAYETDWPELIYGMQVQLLLSAWISTGDYKM